MAFYAEEKNPTAIRQSDPCRSHRGNGEAEGGYVCETGSPHRSEESFSRGEQC